MYAHLKLYCAPGIAWKLFSKLYWVLNMLIMSLLAWASPSRLTKLIWTKLSISPLWVLLSWLNICRVPLFLCLRMWPYLKALERGHQVKWWYLAIITGFLIKRAQRQACTERGQCEGTHTECHRKIKVIQRHKPGACLGYLKMEGAKKAPLVLPSREFR